MIDVILNTLFVALQIAGIVGVGLTISNIIFRL